MRSRDREEKKIQKRKKNMKKSESSNSKDRVEESEEERFDNHCSFLRTHNREKLIQVTCNYFSLGQAELARATLRLLFEENREEDCIHILNSIIYEDPPSKWIFTDDTIISSSEMVLYEPSKRVRRIFVDETSWFPRELSSIFLWYAHFLTAIDACQNKYLISMSWMSCEIVFT